MSQLNISPEENQTSIKKLSYGLVSSSDKKILFLSSKLLQFLYEFEK